MILIKSKVHEDENWSNLGETPHGPGTGIGAPVSTPHARDEVETKLEPTGKEVLFKIVIVNKSFIQDLWTQMNIKTPTEVSFDPSKPPPPRTRPTQTSTLHTVEHHSH